MSTKKATKKPAAAKAKATKARKPVEPKPAKLSALDAAAQVLAKSKEPLSAKLLIEAMAEHGLWTSPGGKTPHATLFSALMREINTKAKESRFKKAERGKFSLA